MINQIKHIFFILLLFGFTSSCIENKIDETKSSEKTAKDVDSSEGFTDEVDSDKIQDSSDETQDSGIEDSAPTPQQTTEPKNLADTDDDEGSTDKVDSDEIQDSAPTPQQTPEPKSLVDTDDDEGSTDEVDFDETQEKHSELHSDSTDEVDSGETQDSTSPPPQQTPEPKSLVDTDDEGSTDEVDTNETQDSGVADSTSPPPQQTPEPKNLVDTDDEGSTDEVDSGKTQDSASPTPQQTPEPESENLVNETKSSEKTAKDVEDSTSSTESSNEASENDDNAENLQITKGSKLNNKKLAQLLVQASGIYSASTQRLDMSLNYQPYPDILSIKLQFNNQITCFIYNKFLENSKNQMQLTEEFRFMLPDRSRLNVTLNPANFSDIYPHPSDINSSIVLVKEFHFDFINGLLINGDIILKWDTKLDKMKVKLENVLNFHQEDERIINTFEIDDWDKVRKIGKYYIFLYQSKIQSLVEECDITLRYNIKK